MQERLEKLQSIALLFGLELQEKIETGGVRVAERWPAEWEYCLIDLLSILESREQNPPKDERAALIWHAHKIATAGRDIVMGESRAPLESIFQSLQGEGGLPYQLAEAQDKVEISILLNKLQGCSAVEIWKNLERDLIHYSANLEAPFSDISYIDHHKLCASLVSCLYLHDLEGNKEEAPFLMVAGEFTGIQDFIYSIISKMAMKSLRGRSFYLEILIEHIMDELLFSLGLNRLQVLYAGGSQFYLLLPNTSNVLQRLENCKTFVNDYLLHHVGTQVYFQLSHTACTAEELGNGLSKTKKDSNEIGNIFRRISQTSAKGKLQRYQNKQLQILFDMDSAHNVLLSESKECIICKKSVSDKELLCNAKELLQENMEICNSCKTFIELGKQIAQWYRRNDVVLAVCKETEGDFTLTLPGMDGEERYLQVLTKEELIRYKKSGKVLRYYALRLDDETDPLCQNILIGNYNINYQTGEGLVEFQDLVERARGIRRLAILRADIDNLGQLFQSGFQNPKEKEPYRGLSLAKSVVLSRKLSYFFKYEINHILEKGCMEGESIARCASITKDASSPRDVVLVYAGGDDVFAVGTWNDIIEFGVDLQSAFQRYTEGKITISAGIGMFEHSYPVHHMATETGDLESFSKKYVHSTGRQKNAVALFGKMPEEALQQVYAWEELRDAVLGEKYAFLQSCTKLDPDEAGDKVFVAKSQWYRIKMLLESQILGEDTRLDIARFAYVLARIKHKKTQARHYERLKTQLLAWMCDKQAAKQLLCAISLYIYEVRGE